MRIAIDARGINLYRGTGIGTYTDMLIKYLLQEDKKNDYILYWCGDNYEGFRKENSHITMTSKRHHRFFEQHFFPYNLENRYVDIFHIPQNGMGLSENIRCKKVCTIHDLIPYVLPETVGKGYELKFLREMPQIIEMSDAILTVSEYSKQDILRFFPMDEKKIHVTPLAADERYRPLNKEICEKVLRDKYNISSPFILYIGGFSPRKNVRALLQAFSKLYKELSESYELVIVGAYRDDAELLKLLSMDLELSSHLRFTGFVPDEELPFFYNCCKVFVYPSIYEGFGLPPLEAMSCGAPVITSNVTSIPEVVGDAGILINPLNIIELQEKLYEVLEGEELNLSLREKGLKRAAEFNWKSTAGKTLKVYESLLEEPTKLL